MSNFPCKIIEADLAADIVTLQMEGDYTVSAGQKYLCDAAPVSAEPVAEVVREALESAKNGLIWYRENFPEAESGADDETEALIEHALACLAAPVAAQPDVTQQTLDDVMAGIPARDAEIEALRKEIEALQAAPVKPYSLDLDPAGIRALTADAISGALALGFQGVSPPPNNEHWLAPFWEIGRESAVQAQQPVSGADGLPVKGDPWSGWACQYPGKLPRLYGDKAIAELNHHPEEGDRLFQLAECIQQDADKVDAERYRAWRYAACKNDRTLIDAMPEYKQNHFRGGNPTAKQFDAAIDYALTAIGAARKEPDR